MKHAFSCALTDDDVGVGPVPAAVSTSGVGGGRSVVSTVGAGTQEPFFCNVLGAIHQLCRAHVGTHTHTHTHTHTRTAFGEDPVPDCSKLTGITGVVVFIVVVVNACCLCACRASF